MDTFTMIDQHAVIKATFSDFRIVKTRKLAQLILEIPIEEADKALLSLGGLPRSDSERWCAIALLDESAIKPIKQDTTFYKERRAFCDLPLPQQAGIKSGDLAFQVWMSVHYPEYENNGDCASAIRNYCGVDSRAKILPYTDAGRRWLALLREFEDVR